MHFRPCLLALLGLVVPLAAQNACPDGGLGSPLFGFTLDGQTGNNGHLGLERVGNEFFVSSRGPGAQPPHKVYVFDGNGVLLRSFSQPAGTSASAWGIRDLTSDGSVLIGGDEFNVYAFDVQGNAVTQLNCANGPRTLGSFANSPAIAVIGTFRALAFDRNGNGGNGSLWAASYASPLVELSLSGAILRQFPNQPGWNAYGIALDAAAGSLWLYSQPSGGDILEISKTTGLPTGRSIPAEGIEGGITIWTQGLRTFVARLDQTGPDVVHVASLRAVSTIADGLELQTQIDGGALDRRFKFLGQGAQLLGVRAQGTPLGAPAACFVNLGNDALQCGSLSGFGTTFDSLADMVVVFAGSVPSGIAIDFPIAPGSTLSIPTAVLPSTGPLRMQAIWLDARVPSPYVPIVATNEVELQIDRRPPLGVTAEARGPNSFNPVTTSGFFSITNPTTVAITRATFTAVGGMYFDPAQTGMADRFDGGNSAVPGCLGTYRNGSAAVAGLDFSVTPISPCDPAARQGFVLGANGTSLEFRFAGSSFLGGVKFEFDCDTDAGAGIDGWAMAGMRVDLDFANGDHRSGVLAIDPVTAQRAFVVL